MMRMEKTYSVLAIELLGGITKTAERLAPYTQPGRPRLTPAAVWNWKKRGVAPEYCIAVEKELGGRILRSDLRPEIYPPAEYDQKSESGRAA